MAKPVWHLLSYDITKNNRLQRVHRLLKKQGLAAQESVFFVRATETQMQLLLKQIEKIIDSKQDDIRTYPIQHPSKVWMAGLQTQTQLLLSDEEVPTYSLKGMAIKLKNWAFSKNSKSITKTEKS